MRGPAGHGDDLEGGEHASVGAAEPLGVELAGALQHAAGQRAPLCKHVCLAHGPEVADELHRMGVGHLHPVDVGHWQGEAGALQQGGGVQDVGEG